MILASGVLTGVLSARFLGPEAKGHLVTVTVWAGTILYAGTLGLSEATAYFTARSAGNEARVWSTAHLVSLSLGALITVVGWMLLPLILHRQPLALQTTAQTFFAFYAIPCLASLCATAWLQGYGAMGWFNVARVSTHVVNAVAMAAVVATGHLTLLAFAAALLLGNAVTWPLAFIGKRALQLESAPASTALAKQMLSYGAKVQLGNWSSMANVRLDQLLLSTLVPAAALGSYAVAVSYAGLIGIIPGAISLVVLRGLVTEFASGAGKERLVEIHRRSFWTMVAIAALASVAAPIGIPFVFGKGYEQSINLTLLLIPAAVFTGSNQILSTGFRAAGLPGIASRAEIVGLIVTVVALSVSLPSLGTLGAALSSLAAYAATTTYLLVRFRMFDQPVRTLFLLSVADLQSGRGVMVSLTSRIRRSQ